MNGIIPGRDMEAPAAKAAFRFRENEVDMYTFNSRVRYSETDEGGRLSVSGIINYMQDCSTFQSEDCGVGVGYLEASHKAWLLSSWQIMIDRYPRLGEKLAVGTWHCASKGIYGYRNFVLRDEDGTDVVRAESLWFLYDTDKNVPIRVQPGDTAPYGEPEPRLVLSPCPRKIPVPGDCEAGEPIVVARHHIDTNHHVNNAQYVEMAREAIPEGLVIKELRADYKKAAVLGDVLTPRVSMARGKDCREWTVVLEGSTGETCAVVWLMTKGQEED